MKGLVTATLFSIALAACANPSPAQFDGPDGNPSAADLATFKRSAEQITTSCVREVRTNLPSISETIARDQCGCVFGYVADNATRHELQAIVRFQINGDRSYADANNLALSRMEAGTQRACPVDRFTAPRRAYPNTLN